MQNIIKAALGAILWALLMIIAAAVIAYLLLYACGLILYGLIVLWLNYGDDALRWAAGLAAILVMLILWLEVRAHRR